MHTNTFRLALLVLFAALLAACSQPPTFEGNLSGRVATADGDPFAGATVTAASTGGADAASLDPQALDTTRTDDDGYFDLTLPSGRYVLMIVGDGFGVTRVVEIVDERLELDLRADVLGHVRGSVVTGDGAAADGAQVHVRNTNRRALTTTDGDYAINDLPAGEYHLSARDADGARAAGVQVSVTAGGTVEAPALELRAETVPEPTIDATSRDYLFFSEYNWQRGVPLRLEITGSGFGETMGLNRLFYGGTEVNTQAIASWSDSAIVVETMNPMLLLGSGFYPYGRLTAQARAPIGAAPPRFEVRTVAGAATSDPVRLVELHFDGFYSGGELESGASGTIQLGANDVHGASLQGLEFDLEANRGTLESDVVVFGTSNHVSIGVTPENDLPHVITVRYGGEVVLTTFIQCCDLNAVSAIDVPMGEAATMVFRVEDLYGDVVGEGVPFDVVVLPDDFAYVSSEVGATVALGRHTTDAASEIHLDLSDLDEPGAYDVLLLQDGNVVADDGYFSLQADGGSD